MKSMIRNERGRIFPASRTTAVFDDRTVTIHVTAVFEYLPRGQYTHFGVRYPDGHEVWSEFEVYARENLHADWRGIGPLTVEHKIVVG